MTLAGALRDTHCACNNCVTNLVCLSNSGYNVRAIILLSGVTMTVELESLRSTLPSQTHNLRPEKGGITMDVLNFIVAAYGTWLQWRRDRQERV